MTTTKTIELGSNRFEVLLRGDEFLGLGRVWIGDTLVRSGRLPLTVATQSFSTGAALDRLALLGIDEGAEEVRIRLGAEFRALQVKMMRDHSFDPIHDVDDWDEARAAGHGELDLVLRPATDSFNGASFAGFSYGYEYRSADTPLFYLLDKASWELGGNIEGATVYSQSACSSPVAHFEPDTAWSTEGILFFLVEAGNENPIMTHNLPRWASHGSFDFQFKGNDTLVGVFERVDLIRSVVAREAGKPELKHFDKYIFDNTLAVTTPVKKILLRAGEGVTEKQQQNLWTWAHCAVEDRARAEYGLYEEPFLPRLSINFWNNFTVDTYRDNLIPAAAAIGCREIFVDNWKKSAMTEESPLPGVFNWNMCCAHEWELSDKLGGVEGVKKVVADCADLGVNIVSWTNNAQALSSPLNQSERDDGGWYVLLEDARQKFGGAYAGCQSTMDMSIDGARQLFVESHLKIKEQTGLNWYLFDSFYNLGFMPVSYRHMSPSTMWRGTLQAVKECQDADIHFLIESFGPFGTPQHGHPSSFNPGTAFICYRVGMGNDYTTVPTGHPLKSAQSDDVESVYYGLAHMAGCDMSIFKDGVRIDQRWGCEQRRALKEYHDCLADMKVRYLQEDGLSVLWHDAGGARATLWNFTARSVALQGRVHDLTAGTDLPAADVYELEALHTYRISDCELPRTVG